MSIITKGRRKSMVIRPSGRSTDYISPSFGYGCLYECSYCYMKRHNPVGLDVATNTEEILTAIDHHSWFADSDVHKPNQTHEKYITYDISCNEDFALHAKYHEWEKIFTFFRDHPKAMASFATKDVNKNLLRFDPKNKVRIRFSLMPEKLREILEPNTNTIEERISVVEDFQDAGYEVHLNFSPVIVYDGWLEDYAELFRTVGAYARACLWDDSSVKAEVIFLTHNEAKHEYNLARQFPGEEYLWKPEIQEIKTSEFGGENIRYKAGLKAQFIKEWTELHDSIIPWNTIRYIF
jgi:spore photoproduct lyase